MSDIDSTDNSSEKSHSNGSPESDSNLLSSRTNFSTESSWTAVSTVTRSNTEKQSNTYDDENTLIDISNTISPTVDESVSSVGNYSAISDYLIPELEKLSFDVSASNVTSEHLVNGISKTFVDDEKSPSEDPYEEELTSVPMPSK